MHDAELGYNFVCYRIIIGILTHIPEMSLKAWMDCTGLGNLRWKINFKSEFPVNSGNRSMDTLQQDLGIQGTWKVWII